jgi:medium-chain acyl-[acyl-carrier-protein] hydrolase
MNTFHRDYMVCPKPRPSASVQLFCFPNAGAGGGAYRGWSDQCHDELEVTLVRYPGKGGRAAKIPYTNIGELVPALVDALPIALDRKFVFYGHSLGGKIAFEVVRELRRRSLGEPSHLFVGACHAPQLPWPYPNVHHLEDGPFIREMQARYGGIPKEVIAEPELLALLIPMLKADVGLIETYRYKPETPLACSITAFGGAGDNTVDRSALEAWRHQTRNSFRLDILPGDHFFVQSARERLLSTIAAEILLQSPEVAVRSEAR